MRKTALLFILIAIALTDLCSAQQRQTRKEVDYVNTIIGTPYAGFAEGLEGGGTIPAVGLPYAMTNFLPQTGESKMGRTSYVYEDKTVMGFLASHQPTVWMGDYGYVSVMPQVGALRTLPHDRALPFDHASEVTKPYYYSVVLDAGSQQKIKAEIAAASRAAIFRFTFPAAEKAHLIIQGIDLNPALADESNDIAARIRKFKGYVRVDKDKNEITGYNPDRVSAQLGPDLPAFKGYFVIQFDKPISSFGTWDNSTVTPGAIEQYGTRMGAYVDFATRAGEKVQVRISTSFISLEQARANLEKEVPGWNFDRLVTSTRDTWQQQLSHIQLEGVTEEQKTIFYTAMFHTMQFPRELSEYGKYYSAFDDKIHEGVSYTDYSLWDTYRALHPLLIFTQPDRVNDMIRALLQMYEQGGRLPMWPNPAETNIMISTHADAVIADAYIKGFRNYNADTAYAALLKDATVPPDDDTLLPYADRDRWTGFEARAGLTAFNSIGYVPFGRTAESVSRTIEYASDDYSVAQMARALGRMDDYRQLLAWSKNY
ncbi:MAG TPA: GH92 family glycosyl hydrolase, partial [Puia sp.]